VLTGESGDSCSFVVSRDFAPFLVLGQPLVAQTWPKERAARRSELTRSGGGQTLTHARSADLAHLSGLLVIRTRMMISGGHNGLPSDGVSGSFPASEQESQDWPKFTACQISAVNSSPTGTVRPEGHMAQRSRIRGDQSVARGHVRGHVASHSQESRSALDLHNQWSG
jgi:hypothetical protein